MPPRPGTQIITRETPQPLSAPTDTGVWFATGLAEKGPSDRAVLVQSLTDFVTQFGTRQSNSVLYDAVEAFFKEGGSKAYISRVVGPAAASAFRVYNDAAAVASLRIEAENAGAWGNSLNVEIVGGDVGGNFKLKITHDTDASINETSADLADTDAAVVYGQQSSLIKVVKLGTVDPVVLAAQSLTGGTDDAAAVTETHWKAALDRISKDHGPGQVSAPGRTTTQAYTDLLNHALANDRVALLDGADTVTVATLTTAAAGLRSLSEVDRYGALFAPWVIVPGIVPGTTRTVPPSAVAAGLMARSDASGKSPNDPAAGANGLLQYGVGLSQAAWTDAQRDTLNTGGVNAFRTLYGGVRLYGYRTLTDPVLDSNWINLGNARLFMGIRAKGGEIAERYVLRQLDGQRRVIAQYGGELAGMLIPYYEAGSLYGQTPEEAFNVNVGPQVNTDASIADGQLKAVISLKMSPFAELVTLELVKTRITEVVS